MNPTLKTFPTTKFVGKNLSFSYADYRAFELWSSFMPRRKEIENAIGTNLYNIQVNPENYDFQPNTLFVKWAAVEVSSFANIPNDMETLEIESGLYAVFQYKGDQQGVAAFFKSIYMEWLPSSGYELENRPQFEILGEKYKNNDPNSEEEIWIPVKHKL
ncbi:GyrI-like domain-containing protein [Flavobacterium branchiophilum]|uniref:Probable transcriptional regulator n=1 Tax=Flavobacterium branchiophilum (strain FL-15) TaxID=1034807 RepID=G2Z2C2_FLABF|nr:GyrI-like domain-containing protein [Flavobacterium branchiophilum]CCB70078.1 Probable transcriptional regulator [Flavobacterium branchiophilum FL-15]